MYNSIILMITTLKDVSDSNQCHFWLSILVITKIQMIISVHKALLEKPHPWSHMWEGKDQFLREMTCGFYQLWAPTY